MTRIVFSSGARYRPASGSHGARSRVRQRFQPLPRRRDQVLAAGTGLDHARQCNAGMPHLVYVDLRDLHDPVAYPHPLTARFRPIRHKSHNRNNSGTRRSPGTARSRPHSGPARTSDRRHERLSTGHLLRRRDPARAPTLLLEAATDLSATLGYKEKPSQCEQPDHPQLSMPAV
jgi:hypothetical protein